MELKLLTLDKYNRQASLGADYYKLNNYYNSESKFNWSKELHANGHIMDIDKLEEIAVYGIISWYIETNINFDIYYNYNERLEHFINFPKNIGYYDWLKINKLAESINIELILKNKTGSKHLELLSYNYEILKKYAIHSWGNFIIDKVGYDKLISFLKLLYEYVKNNYFLNMPFYDLFLERYPDIKKFGIIFQRLKIVLEKINNYNISIENIYKLDKFVDYYQTIIYSLCINYIDNYKNNNINKIIININIDEDLLKPFNTINNEIIFVNITVTEKFIFLYKY
jgi:hypothetical protein